MQVNESNAIYIYPYLDMGYRAHRVYYLNRWKRLNKSKVTYNSSRTRKANDLHSRNGRMKPGQ